MAKTAPGNGEIAGLFERTADLLEAKGGNVFRVRSYRRAAGVVRGLARPVRETLERQGRSGLTSLEGIGDKLAGSIEEIVETGRLGLLERLESGSAPESLLADVPGIGAKTARRIHDRLGIDSLEELEIAAHDGRLEEIEGLGKKRIEGIRDALAGRLSRSAGRRARVRARKKGASEEAEDRPDVGAILKLDAEYRRRADAGKLRTISPKRFNPEGESWLPIMKTAREGWSFTILFSNTARAHELGKTHDWVVIYYRKDGTEKQCTVVTASRGPLQGRRVIRGRERECRGYYDGNEE